MPWETWTTTLDVAIALADDAGLQLAVDEGDVVRDLVLESRTGSVLEYAGNRYELFDPVLDFVGHDAPALRVLVVYFFPAVTFEPADLEVLVAPEVNLVRARGGPSRFRENITRDCSTIPRRFATRGD